MGAYEFSDLELKEYAEKLVDMALRLPERSTAEGIVRDIKRNNLKKEHVEKLFLYMKKEIGDCGLLQRSHKKFKKKRTFMQLAQEIAERELRIKLDDSEHLL
ncbi:MAG: hypothetical protein K5894_10525 [Lachnospiraceae bacterium]|nr:hypothetical protein [Lachnospiraceae bacterium]